MSADLDRAQPGAQVTLRLSDGGAMVALVVTVLGEDGTTARRITTLFPPEQAREMAQELDDLADLADDR